MFDFDRRCAACHRGSGGLFFERAMETKYTGITPSGREVSGRLEVEDGISYIVMVDADDYETWYMVHTSTVRKEEIE